jgi:hypothetical protein
MAFLANSSASFLFAGLNAYVYVCESVWKGERKAKVPDGMNEQVHEYKG